MIAWAQSHRSEELFHKDTKHALEWHEHGDSTNESNELYKHQSQPHRQANDHSERKH